jgi:DNA-binding SARP family transcriptional activator
MSSRRPCSVVLLGRIDVEGIDAAASPSLAIQTKAIALLALLSIPSLDRFVRRDVIVGYLWPELTQERARAALRKTVHVIRQTLGTEALASRGDDDLALSSAAVSCDAADFIQAADDGRLMHALRLYGGDLLPGFALDDCVEFERWLYEARADARERAAALAWALAQRFESDAQLSDAAGMARRAIRYSRRDERALRRALQMLARVGDRAGAIGLYDDFARGLRSDLGIDPSAETIRLVEEIRGGGAIA